jgi:hypothetical protein
MNNGLLVLLSTAVLSSGLAILLAALEQSWLAQALAVVAAMCGLTAFALVAVWTVRRARRLGPEGRR